MKTSPDLSFVLCTFTNSPLRKGTVFNVCACTQKAEASSINAEISMSVYKYRKATPEILENFSSWRRTKITADKLGVALSREGENPLGTSKAWA